jgi:hypothetical protein
LDQRRLAQQARSAPQAKAPSSTVDQSRRRRRTWQYRRIWPICATITLSLLLVIAGLPVYVFPPDDSAAQADTVLVLGLPTRARIQVARAVSEQHGDIPIFVSSPGMNGYWCGQPDLTCLEPIPPTTKGEARLLSELAETYGFEHPVVVTFTPHVVRTRYIFQRCYGADVSIVGARDTLTAFDFIYQYAYQTVAFLKNATRPC